MSKKLGLALGSGGARGIAHVGFLQALEEANIKADFVTGCSMGAIVGACYCAGVPIEDVKKAALSLKLSSIAALNLAPLKNNGLFRITKARNLMEGLIGEKTFDELQIPFACVATDMVEGTTVVLNEGNVIDAALASSTLPGVFTPTELNGRTLLDGGLLERVPTHQLKKMGAEAIVAVDVLGDLMVKKVSGNLVDTLLRCIDIMDTRATQKKRRSRAKYIDLWLEPDLGGMDQYKVKNLQFAYEKGYELGVANRDKIKRLIGDEE